MSKLVKNAATARYPYTYARICAMKSALLKKQDYARLLKMSNSEIAGFLESTQYKKEIDELGVQYKGTELIEIALNRNLANTYRKLKAIANPELRMLAHIYLRRNDINNLKTIIRGKYTNATEQQITAMLQPYSHTQEQLKELLKKESIEEIIRAGKAGSRQMTAAIEKFRETKMLMEIENAMDARYAEETEKLAGLLPGNSRFKKFLKKEMETTAILNILRLKREGADKREIQKRIHMQALSRKARKLLDAPPQEILNALEQTEYGEAAKRGITEYREKGTLIYLEADLHRSLLRKALLLTRQKPLLGDSILGYVFAKEIEVRNLKTIIKAKELGLPGEFTEEQVITL